MKVENKTLKLPMEQLIQVVQLQLSEKGSASLAVTGNSMWPMLRHMRDQVLLAPAKTFKKGDIILYQRRNGQYILHRILRKKKGYVICAGDNQCEKERVENSWVLAVVTDFYRKGKRYSVTQMGYRLYRWMWIMLFPVRKIVLWVARRLVLLKNKILGGR